MNFKSFINIKMSGSISRDLPLKKNKGLGCLWNKKNICWHVGIMQPLDLLLFAIMKKSYRRWLGEFKLQNNKVNEELAVKKIVEITPPMWI